MNNSLLQLAAQLKTIWKELGLNQRVTVALSGALVVGGLASLVFWSSRTDYALLYGKLDSAEAGKVIQALDDAKVPYKVSGSGGNIMVPADKVHQMRMQLAGKGIPRGGEGVGFEIFDKPNFGISDFVQRANYLRAVQGELSRTISQVDQIESARVMVVMPENRLLVDSQKKPTASVFVKVRGNATLPPQSVAAIRFLVANSVEGLTSNYVTVVDNSGNVLSENNSDDTITGLTTTQLAARKNLEQYLSKKAEGMLEKALGPGQAIVRVSADINFDTMTRTEEKYDPEAQVKRIETINDEQVESTTQNEQGGVPGVQTNAATGETNSVAGPTPTTVSKTKKSVKNNQYEINKTVSTLAQSAGGVTRVSAAVFVASQFTGTGTNRVAAPRQPQDLEKLKRIVMSAIGAKEGAESKDLVTLEEMAFNDTQAVELNQQLETQQKREMWVDLGSKALYPALALVVLAFFWRTFKRTPNENIPVGVPLGDEELEAMGSRNGKNKTPGVVTVDVLNQLIRENPDNMTQALRGWMTSGAPSNKKN